MEVARTTSCLNVAKITVYERSQFKKTVITALFVLAYAIVLPYVYNTMGEPLRRAVEQAKELDLKRDLDHDAEAVISWDDEEEVADLGFGDGDASGAEDALLFDMDTLMEDDVLEGGDALASEEDGASASEDGASASSDDRANATSTSNSTSFEDEPRPLPSPFLPDAGATAAMFLLVSSHALYHLLCRWFVGFRAMTNFSPSNQVTAGSFFLLQPHPHRGKAELCVVRTSKLTDLLEFEFQRQKFEYLAPGVKLGDDQQVAAGDQEDDDHGAQVVEAALKAAEDVMRKCGVVRPVRSKTDGPIKDYVGSRGLGGAASVAETLERFGSNSLTLEEKGFKAILTEQLLSPLSMFQLFSAALWLMDEYWQYTIFTLLSIVMMEATTSFQRWRTLRTLKGLSPKPYDVPVFRDNKWVMLSTDGLLPGDIISLSTATSTTPDTKIDGDQDAPKPSKNAPRSANAARNVVPCDCLLINGNGVVNEATLTGESVPQMKDAVVMSDSKSSSGVDRHLDMHGGDRVHVFFSGTSLISTTRGKKSSIPAPPDNGCLCYVLRTGFSSAQGELMQMIEFSTESVSSDSKETGMALLILLIFALCSSGYVFKKGMEKGDRTTHELLLKCVIIITSVVPRQLPVQMALAVNHALMTLMKEGLFCTEPYRVPYAGKVTHCLFDKTGTLTTDELVPVGVVNAKSTDQAVKVQNVVPVNEAQPQAAMVLAACQSLVAMPGKKPSAGAELEKTALLGDPIELAAMKGVEWRFDPATQTAFPGDWEAKEISLKKLHMQLDSLPEQARIEGGGSRGKRDRGNASVADVLKKQIAHLEKRIAEVKEKASQSPISAIRIFHRYHFSSKLQRMSVLCSVTEKGGATENYVLVKGSPEALEPLIDPASLPSWFNSTYLDMAERGMRILALAYRKSRHGEDLNNLARDAAEKDLMFAGFVSFECKVRSDSAMVIESLRAADHRVSMLTGDAPLTALHVARVTGICAPLDSVDASDATYDQARKPGKPLLLDVVCGDTGKEKVQWVGALGECADVQVPFSVDSDDCGLGALSTKHDLLVTETALLASAKMSKGKVWGGVEHIQVFSRMSPQGKARVIRSIQSKTEGRQQEHFVLMCGDGGNDVGALKQSDVGLALLSGYGNANTGSGGDAAEKQQDEDGSSDGKAEKKDAETALNEKRKLEKKEMAKMAKLKKAEFDVAKKKILAKQQELVQAKVEELKRNGEDHGIVAHMRVVKDVAMQLRREVQLEGQKIERKYNIHFKNSKPGSGPKTPEEMLEESLEAFEDPNALPVVRPGDASVAAPFTSRTPSVASVVQLIRQGRCTLLSALQQQQIMMLECTISAYCLAALSLEGARSSERQMMASGWLIMTASVAFSYSTPVERMHPVRPIKSLFHPSIALSVLGQAVIHLGCMLYAVRLATEEMGAEKLKEVVTFNRNAAKGLATATSEDEELDPMAEFMMMWSQPFMPNLMNTVIFLVETSQIMAVLFVNYKGRPWMKGLMENHALFLSLAICIGGIAMCAWEVNPWLNSMIHLEPFPNDEFRWTVMGLVMLSLVGTFVWDRLMTAIFAPEVFSAMLESGRQTTIKDVIPLFQTVGKVLVGCLVVGSGNPLVWFGAWWMYKKYKAQEEE